MGVFETLLVADGRPVALERHLARLALSVRTLYRCPLPAGLAAELRARARPLGMARMRVNARPRTGRPAIDVDVELSAVPERQLPVPLVPRTLPGGLGAHKWIDRRLLEGLGGEGQPLLCDLDGQVLEAARASVFAVQGERRLVTPPADGRILPGVTRARVLELAPWLGLELRIAPFDLRELGEASELFVTGALGGVEPAQLEGDAARGVNVTTLLRTALDKNPLQVILR